MEPTWEKLTALTNPQEWILQEKVQYAQFVPTPEGPKSKAEIRMMFVWPEGGEPMLVLERAHVVVDLGEMLGELRLAQGEGLARRCHDQRVQPEPSRDLAVRRGLHADHDADGPGRPRRDR